MKNILVMFGHTRNNSFCSALTEEYIKGAEEAGHSVKKIYLSEFGLEKYLSYKHLELPENVDAISEIQNKITEAHHLVVSYPTWWASPPALVKVFFEMIFEPGFAFQYIENKGSIPKWNKLLRGKSARIISTMDSPTWYYKWITGDPGYKAVAGGIFNFCGVTPVEKSYFGSVKTSDKATRAKWLEKAYSTGLNEKL